MGAILMRKKQGNKNKNIFMKQIQFVIMFDMEYSHEILLIFSVENNLSCSAIGIVHYV